MSQALKAATASLQGRLANLRKTLALVPLESDRRACRVLIWLLQGELDSFQFSPMAELAASDILGIAPAKLGPGDPAQPPRYSPGIHDYGAY